MDYVITEDTKGCLFCGNFFEAKRADAIFCTTECKEKHRALPEEKRYLNPPIVNRGPLKEGDLYTSHGQELPLSNGILRVRLRWADPAKKKDEQPIAENGQERPKRRGA